jgi:hypothetical protein
MDIVGIFIACVTCQAVLVQFADSLPRGVSVGLPPAGNVVFGLMVMVASG